MNSQICRWGILGAANIARRNWQAVRDAGNATLIAVASRDAGRCAQYVAECQSCVPFPEAPLALGSYEELIARPDIDAVYIPLPTGLRKPWVLRAAEAGKHVLVEKPLGVSAADVEEMIAACERHKVQFMDGVMFMHGKRLRRLREVLDDAQTIGELRRISSDFSFIGDERFMQGNIRTHGELEPLGALGDLGWYCIRFSLWAMKYQMPVAASGRVLTEVRQSGASAATPIDFSGELVFPGVSAAFHCSFTTQNAQWAIVSGSKGYLHVPDFVLPYSGPQTTFSVTRSEFIVEGCQFDMHERRTEERIDERSSNAPDAQETGLFRTFSDLVLSGKIDDYWPQIALMTQQVLDGCLKSARNGSTPVSL